MKRRDFLQGVAAAGAVAISPAHGISDTAPGRVEQSAQSHPFPLTLDEDAAHRELLHVENDYLSFTLFGDARASIIDRKTGAQWRMGPVALQEESEIDLGQVWLRTERSICEQYPGRFLGQREGDNVRFWLRGRENHVMGSFLIHISLDGPWLEYRLLEVDEQLPSLSFPPAIESASLVLPMHVGRWIQKPVANRFVYPFFSHLNMRWFGGLNQGNGWLAVFPEANFVDSGVMLTEMAAAPVWLKQLGRWSEPRAVRYRFIAGSYVELALSYREWAVSHGIHRSLTEKLKSTPALANLTQGRLVSMLEATPLHGKGYDENLLRSTKGDELLGSGTHVMFTHAQAQECIRDLPKAGVERALVVVRGWIPGGYDDSHPDVWPPEQKLGSIAEFKQLCTSDTEYPVALHDNYQDIYTQSKSWPRGVIRERNGEHMPGGYWAGGQAYIVNARDGLSYAKRNWKSLAQLQLRAYYVDTTSAVQIYQSYAPGNTLTRSHDMAAKVEMLRFFKSHGVVLGSEEGADFAVPYLDWNENRHARQLGESVPLWPLVFHDAVVGSRYTSDDDAAEWAGGLAAGASYPSWLEDMLWGYAVMSHIGNYQHREAALRAMARKNHVDAWFRQISTAAMVNHCFLTADASLEQTSFSTGHRIIVNFADHPQTYDGQSIAAKGYQIFAPLQA